MQYSRSNLAITVNDFIVKINQVKEFSSTSGKRYKVTSCSKDYIKFLRLDGKKPDMEWSINLSKLFEAYQQLEDFSTANFKPFAPRTHSPARGLLMHIGLIKCIE